jgi:ABC-2 type transport system permease protein
MLEYQSYFTNKTITTSQDEAEQLINKTEAWGFVLIPDGAEQRLVQAQDAQISIAYNQSFLVLGIPFLLRC